jgi:hypothetical protein
METRLDYYQLQKKQDASLRMTREGGAASHDPAISSSPFLDLIQNLQSDELSEAI